MVKFVPHKYICVRCERKQYSNMECRGCGSIHFREIANEDRQTISVTDEELDMICHWGFIVSTERPLAEKERELYFKLTGGESNNETR